MSKNIECEERLMLTKEQYEKLFAIFASHENSKIIIQINYYFDDNSLSLRDAHRVLRVRAINDSTFELTMKIKGDSGDIEINIPLSKEGAQKIVNSSIFDNEEITNRIKEVTNKEIKLITSLETKRLEVEFEDHLLVIDANHYSDITDYDLEIEAGSIKEAKRYILKYAEGYGLTYHKKYASKSRRAINKALGIS